LGWFKDDRTEEGVLRNIEDMMRRKGETVKKGRIDAGGVVEYTE
jgi:protein import protein ZIM17